jgi:hypothetical protein
MSTTLLELQQAFRAALLAGDDAALAALIHEDGLPAAERIDVYRHNVVASLTEVLADTYPAVCRLVDRRFFGYAAHEFLTTHPPARPRLAEYGGGFADFLAGFAPCRELEYLPDVARLEWLVHSAAHAAEAAPIAAAALASWPPEATPNLVLRLHPSIGHLRSPWPVDRLWAANRTCEAENAEAVDLGAGGVLLEVARAGHGVALRSLGPGVFAFRAALSGGATLTAAAEAGLAADDAFDVPAALADVFGSGAAVGIELPPDS